MGIQLNDLELRVVQISVWIWCALLVVLPIIAALVVEPSTYWILPLILLGVPSAGLLLVTWAVLPRVGKVLWKFGDTAAVQEKQLKHIRTLAGVQGVVGLAFIATIGIFEPGPLEHHVLTASIVWVATASVYFFAFWGLVRMERG